MWGLEHVIALTNHCHGNGNKQCDHDDEYSKTDAEDPMHHDRLTRA